SSTRLKPKSIRSACARYRSSSNCTTTSDQSVTDPDQKAGEQSPAFYRFNFIASAGLVSVAACGKEPSWQTDDDKHDLCDEGVQDVEVQLTVLQSPDWQELLVDAGDEGQVYPFKNCFRHMAFKM